jgi:hypothetical protein
MNATKAQLWTALQIQERIDACREHGRGASGRLWEILASDPNADVAEQIQLIRNCSLALAEAKQAQARFGAEADQLEAMLPELYDSGATIEWTPEHHPM